MTYRDKEIMARWRKGHSTDDISSSLRMTVVEVERVISANRQTGENDPAPKRLMDRFNV